MSKRLNKIRGKWTDDRLRRLPGVSDIRQSMDEVFTCVVQADPTSQHKMVDWLLTAWENKGFLWEDIRTGPNSKIAQTMSDFERLKSRLTKEDGIPDIQARSLMQYKTPGEIWTRLKPLLAREDELGETQSSRAQKRLDMAKARLECLTKEWPSGLKMDIPVTRFASSVMGRNTKWCTAADNDNMFEEYSEQGPLMIFTLPDGTRFQAHIEVMSKDEIDMESDDKDDFDRETEYEWNYTFKSHIDIALKQERLKPDEVGQKFVSSASVSFMNEADDTPTLEEIKKASPYLRDIAAAITEISLKAADCTDVWKHTGHQGDEILKSIEDAILKRIMLFRANEIYRDANRDGYTGVTRQTSLAPSIEENELHVGAFPFLEKNDAISVDDSGNVALKILGDESFYGYCKRISASMKSDTPTTTLEMSITKKLVDYLGTIHLSDDNIEWMKKSFFVEKTYADLSNQKDIISIMASTLYNEHNVDRAFPDGVTTLPVMPVGYPFRYLDMIRANDFATMKGMIAFTRNSYIHAWTEAAIATGQDMSEIAISAFDANLRTLENTNEVNTSGKVSRSKTVSDNMKTEFRRVLYSMEKSIGSSMKPLFPFLDYAAKIIFPGEADENIRFLKICRAAMGRGIHGRDASKFYDPKTGCIGNNSISLMHKNIENSLISGEWSPLAKEGIRLMMLDKANKISDISGMSINDFPQPFQEALNLVSNFYHDDDGELKTHGTYRSGTVDYHLLISVCSHASIGQIDLAPSRLDIASRSFSISFPTQEDIQILQKEDLNKNRCSHETTLYFLRKQNDANALTRGVLNGMKRCGLINTEQSIECLAFARDMSDYIDYTTKLDAGTAPLSAYQGMNGY